MAFVLIAELTLLNGCSNKPGSTPIPTSILIPWHDVTVYTNPNSQIITQVNKDFSIVVTFQLIPYELNWQSSDSSAFSLLDSVSTQKPSTSGVAPIAYLFEALKIGKFQIVFSTIDKLNHINQSATFNIEVNP